MENVSTAGHSFEAAVAPLAKVEVEGVAVLSGIAVRGVRQRRGRVRRRRGILARCLPVVLILVGGRGAPRVPTTLGGARRHA